MLQPQRGKTIYNGHVGLEFLPGFPFRGRSFAQYFVDRGTALRGRLLVSHFTEAAAEVYRNLLKGYLMNVFKRRLLK